MYKLSVICFVLAASFVERNDAMTDAQKSKVYAKLLTAGMECMKDFPLTLDHIKAFRSKKAPTDEVGKCYTHCLFKKVGVMDDNGKLSEETAKAEARRIFKEGDEVLSKVDDLFSKCIHVNEEETSDGDKGCDRAKLAFECFVEHAPELGLDVDL